MGVLGAPDLLVLATIVITCVVPVWLGARVARKSGFSRAWALLLLFIPLHPILLWIFAFVPWPALDRANQNPPGLAE